jgi:outer membrane protein OmpA-like peptidoglycan-associated protein
MTNEHPTEEYELAPESGRRFGWIAAALALAMAVGAGVWGWSAQRGADQAQRALAAALAERDEAAAAAKQWQSLLDQAETAAQGTDAKVAELEQRVRSLDELLQTTNTEVSRLESELAARGPESVVSEEPPAAPAEIAVTALPAEGGSLGTVAPAPVTAVEPAAAPAEEPAPKPAAVAPVATASTTEETLAIVFDVNSSYLPASLSGKLRELAARLQPGRTYEVELVGSVGHPDVEGQSAEEALRYNRWMAERRMTRVAELLRSNTKAEALTIRQEFALNDPSRRVLVEVKPLVN